MQKLVSKTLMFKICLNNKTKPLFNLAKFNAGDKSRTTKDDKEGNKGAKFANVDKYNSQSTSNDEGFNTDRISNPNEKDNHKMATKPLTSENIISKEHFTNDNTVLSAKDRQNLYQFEDSREAFNKSRNIPRAKGGNLGDKTGEMKDNVMAGKEDLVSGQLRDKEGKNDASFDTGDMYKFDLSRDEVKVEDEMKKQRELKNKKDPKMDSLNK